MKKAVVLLALLLSGCTETQTAGLPDGSQGVLINCGDNGIYVEGMGQCYVKAGKACPNGYDEIRRENLTMLIRCKDPKSPRS